MNNLEDLLRQSAPALPPGLKSRTLTKCALAKAQRRQRVQWQLRLAVAGVFALQMLTLSRLDAQNAQLIAGNSPPRAFAPVSMAQVTEMLHQRSRQLAVLLASSKVG
jgi:hypothetical protein